LLAALGDDARQSYLSLGRHVSLSAPSVRDRLIHLRDKGILQGFMLSIDPSVFERNDLLLFFIGNFSRQDALKALSAKDVSWISWKLDGKLTVGLWTNDEQRVANELAKILGARHANQALTPRKNRARLSLIDFSIMDALVDDPKLPFGDLVKATGVSPKTLRKHLEYLIGSKTISIEPCLGSLSDSGELIYQLLVSGTISMSEVRRVVGEAALTHYTQHPPMKYVLCRGSSLNEVLMKTRTLEQTEGVKSVIISLTKEIFVSTQFRHSLIRAEIGKLSNVR
jgi:DNA-binding Lrp family transcriptional regulator